MGVDPRQDCFDAARSRVFEARFLAAIVKGIPREDASRDAAIFLNALHKVPNAAIDATLAVALRALRRGSVLVVIEPLAVGSFFCDMQPFDDEMVVRSHAIEAMDRPAASGACNEVLRDRYKMQARINDLAAFLDDLRKAEPCRSDGLRKQWDAVAAVFRENATRTPDGHVLIQPLLA